MTRRSKRKAAENLGYMLIADGENEQWYLELLKDYYTLKIKITPHLAHSLSIKSQYELVRKSISDGYEHVIWILDIDQVIKEYRESKDGKEFTTFKNLYINAVGKKEWDDKLTIIVNNPCLEYWYFLHKNPTSTKYFGTYEELLKDLKTFTIDKRLFSCYDKKENEDYRAGEGLYKKLLPYLKKMKFSKLKAFDIEECDCESVSEMYKLFKVLQIQP